MNRVSVYVKGDRSSTAYYRIYQYIDRIDSIQVDYNEMYPRWVQRHYMPVSSQNKPLQAIVYVLSFFRVLFALLHDSLHIPSAIVIHKRLLSRYMPYCFRYLLLLAHKKGVKIIWDFDDHLVAGREMSSDVFSFFSSISDRIIVTHEFLLGLVDPVYQNKVSILPTTDGDMYNAFDLVFLNDKRESLLKTRVNIVWVATSGNINNLLPVISYLDIAANEINRQGREMVLNVVCDKPIECTVNHLVINNVEWSRQEAIHYMSISHIGIMPLINNEYNKGKGGFKLVQYLSVSLPAIGSNIGYNKHVLSDNCGYLVDNGQQWVSALLDIADPSKWRAFANNAYARWNEFFSYEQNLEYWKQILK